MRSIGRIPEFAEVKVKLAPGTYAMTNYGVDLVHRLTPKYFYVKIGGFHGKHNERRIAQASVIGVFKDFDYAFDTRDMMRKAKEEGLLGGDVLLPMKILHERLAAQ